MDMEELTIHTQDLITFTEAARILKVSRPTLYNMVKRVPFHPVVFGNNRYLLKTEVEAAKNG